MNDLSFSDPCLLFPLRREWRGFRREFHRNQRFPGGPCTAWFCGPAWLTVLVVETGMGRQSTEDALDWLLGGPLLGGVPYHPKLVLSAGYAGALREGRAVGDILLATEVVDGEGGRWATTWPGELPGGKWDPPLCRGRVLSVADVVSSSARKAELGRAHDAEAVDLESATVARRCIAMGVPFGCVRAISDDASTSLSPRLAGLLQNGGASWPRWLAAVVRSPGMLGELRRLARDTARGSDRLGKALGELLTLTLPWRE
jgi:hypothetical protein